MGHARNVAARPIKFATNQAHRIGAVTNTIGIVWSPLGAMRWPPACYVAATLPASRNQIVAKAGSRSWCFLPQRYVDRDVLALDDPSFAETLPECGPSLPALPDVLANLRSTPITGIAGCCARAAAATAAAPPKA